MSLGLPQAEVYFEQVAPVLKAADVFVGQVEHVFTSRGIVTSTGVASPPCNPENIKAFGYAGLTVATLAGNHIWDSGPPGIEDTIAGLRNQGIVTAGAGMNIEEARKPALIERNGTRIGFLDYNCVGPQRTWATKDKAGCAYVDIITHYRLDHPTPGGLPTIYTFPEPDSLHEMLVDIRLLRADCDVLVVSLHKGIGHTPIKLAGYEKYLAHAAIDAGADLILGHHAHILKGIEVYKGKAIFHGLGNFVTVVRHLTADASDDTKGWAKRRKEVFAFEPDPDFPACYPFHPEAKWTIIAKCSIENGEIKKVGFFPCRMSKKARPEILPNDEQGKQMVDYMTKITKGSALNARYEWDGDEVFIAV
jgi:poly-gamma-glutamate capsule biosynthesis protein CapA/YwtB (metallophosphatase superfamily)